MWKIVAVIIIVMIITESKIVLSYGSTQDKASTDYSHIETNIGYLQCRFKENDYSLTCFGGIDEKWRKEKVTIYSLILYNSSNAILNLQEVLRGFSSLRKLTMSNSNFSKLINTFSEGNQFLEKVNLTHNRLEGLAMDVFTNFTNLRVIDLRNNALTDVKPEGFDASNLRYVYLSGNPLKCTHDMAWILDLQNGSLASKVSDRDKLRCSVSHEGRPLVPVIEIMMALQEECKRTVCECELVYVVARGSKRTPKQLMAFASVNCSYRGLTDMPNFLPANTTTLRLAGNKIKDLTPLVKNPVYKQVLDLYLDENLVESIVQLDGSYWLDHFRLLSLRGNQLSDLPTYALENVLLKSGNAARLFLGNNPWRCDCLFTPGFQDLLIRYTNLVRDINEVRCAFIRDDENSNKQIRDLTRTEICISPDENSLIYPLDILNIVLAFLIFLILGKLLYDYWLFKKTGKLPWIVSKIP